LYNYNHTSQQKNIKSVDFPPDHRIIRTRKEIYKDISFYWRSENFYPLELAVLSDANIPFKAVWSTNVLASTHNMHTWSRIFATKISPLVSVPPSRTPGLIKVMQPALPFSPEGGQNSILYWIMLDVSTVNQQAT